MTITGSPAIQRPAATPLASSSVEHVSTFTSRSLSRAASTVFWCVSGTLMIQPRGSLRRAPLRSARKMSLYVSMMRGAGIDSGMAMSSGLLLVAEAHGAGVVVEAAVLDDQEEGQVVAVIVVRMRVRGRRVDWQPDAVMITPPAHHGVAVLASHDE